MIATILSLLLTEPAELPPCVDKASELLRADAYEEAAVYAERCWLVTRHTQSLLIAAQAWVHAQHYAHAAFVLTRYSERAGAATWSHDVVAELKSRIHSNTGELVVTIDPPLRPGELVRFELEFLGGAHPTLVGRAADLAFRLDIGRWRVRVHRDGYAVWTEDLMMNRHLLRRSAETRPLPGPAALPVATATTRVEVGPARAIRHGYTLQLNDADDPAARPLTFTADTAALALYLAPGRWQLQARAPGLASTTSTFTAGAPVRLELRRGGTP